MIRKVAVATWWSCCVFASASLAAAADFRLVDAVQKQDKEAARTLLKQHADVNAHETGGVSALTWAAHWDDVDTAELLIGAGADVNASNIFGDTPLWEACNN